MFSLVKQWEKKRAEWKFSWLVLDGASRMLIAFGAGVLVAQWLPSLVAWGMIALGLLMAIPVKIAFLRNS